MKRLITNENGTITAEWKDDRTGRELESLFTNRLQAKKWLQRQDASARLEACAFVLACIEQEDKNNAELYEHDRTERWLKQRQHIRDAVTHAVGLGIKASAIADALGVREWNVFDDYAYNRINKPGEDSNKKQQQPNNPRKQGETSGQVNVPTPLQFGAEERPAASVNEEELAEEQRQWEDTLSDLQRQLGNLSDRVSDLDSDLDEMTTRVDMLNTLTPVIKTTITNSVREYPSSEGNMISNPGYRWEQGTFYAYRYIHTKSSQMIGWVIKLEENTPHRWAPGWSCGFLDQQETKHGKECYSLETAMRTVESAVRDQERHSGADAGWRHWREDKNDVMLYLNKNGATLGALEPIENNENLYQARVYYDHSESGYLIGSYLTLEKAQRRIEEWWTITTGTPQPRRRDSTGHYWHEKENNTWMYLRCSSPDDPVDPVSLGRIKKTGQHKWEAVLFHPEAPTRRCYEDLEQAQHAVEEWWNEGTTRKQGPDDSGTDLDPCGLPDRSETTYYWVDNAGEYLYLQNIGDNEPSEVGVVFEETDSPGRWRAEVFHPDFKDGFAGTFCSSREGQTAVENWWEKQADLEQVSDLPSRWWKDRPGIGEYYFIDRETNDTVGFARALRTKGELTGDYEAVVYPSGGHPPVNRGIYGSVEGAKAAIIVWWPAETVWYSAPGGVKLYKQTDDTSVLLGVLRPQHMKAVGGSVYSAVVYPTNGEEKNKNLGQYLRLEDAKRRVEEWWAAAWQNETTPAAGETESETDPWRLRQGAVYAALKRNRKS